MHRGSATLAALLALASWTAVALPLPGEPPGDPAVVGAWSEPIPLPMRAIHSVLLPTGKIFTWPDQLFGGVFDPADDSFDTNVLEGLDNIFCAGHVLLPDGRVYIVGGSVLYQNFGTTPTFWFDGFDHTWWRGPELHHPHYYGTLVTLPDGRLLTHGGQDYAYLTTNATEVMTPGPEEAWEAVPGPALPLEEALFGSYPRLEQLPDGRLVRAGPAAQTLFVDPADFAWTEGPRSPAGALSDGISVLLPGLDRVLVAGGRQGEVTTNEAWVLDLRGEPAWGSVAPMHRARSEHNAVLLPGGEVLVIGGSGTDRVLGQLEPELYDPAADAWTLLAPGHRGRTYHSTALLLPDGRVWVAGGDRETPLDATPTLYSAEYYHPPYLFRGPRPLLAEAPGAIAYGEVFEARSPDAAGVAKAVLYRAPSVTHSWDMARRHVALDFVADGDRLLLRAPAHGAVAPPGWYMLFLVDHAGVPSVARMMALA